MTSATQRGAARLLLACGALLGIMSPAVHGDDKATLLGAFRRAEKLEKQGRYAEAALEYEKAVQLAPRVFGNEDANTATVMNNLAGVYRSMGRYTEAEPLLVRALEITKRSLGEDHPNYATSLDNLAALYESMGQYAKAESLCVRAMEIRRKALGEDHPEYATSLNNLAELYGSMGRYAKAEPLYVQALAIRSKALGEDHPAYATSLNNLAGLYYSMGQYAEAEPLYARAMEIRRKALGEDHPHYATSMNNLAGLYGLMGQYAKAEPVYIRAMEISRRALGEDHPNYAASLNNLALLYNSMGRYAEAEPLYVRAMEIWRKAVGEDHPDYATSLNNLAALYRSMGRYAGAEPLFVRAMEISRKSHGENHPSYAVSLNNLAELYGLMGQYAKAESLYVQALPIRSKALGQDHPDYAGSLNNLAGLYQSTAQYAKAEPLYVQTMEIWKKALGEDHPNYAASLINLASLYAAMENWDGAVEHEMYARRVIRRHVDNVLPALSESEQLTFLQSQDEGPFHGALSLGLLLGRQPAAVTSSAEWLLNDKAVAGAVLAERARLALDSNDARTRDVAEELTNTRAMLANLTMRKPKDGNYARHRGQIAELTAREHELSKQLGQLTGRAYRVDPWVTLDEVRTSLAVDSVLIELARFDVFNFKAKGQENKWQPTRYAAWVVAAQGRVRLIDLGEAEPIEQAVEAFREAMQSAGAAVASDPAAAERVLRGRLRRVAQLVLAPLEPYIGDSDHWLISPDGALWLVPWGSLPMADGNYALERHRLSYLISGRDLVTGGYKVEPRRSLVMADPDYDLGVAEAKAEAARVLAGERLALATVRGGPARSEEIGTMRWRRLSGTAAEAQAIAPKLRLYARHEPSLYTGRQALEGVFKATRRPRVVVLSTHGFFLADQDYENMPLPAGMRERGTFLAPKRAPGEVPARPVKIENPLLRCGLVLAGANNRDQAQGDSDDGVLTGLEIVGTDLRGTELVVLSACETGVGTVQNGEGVAGLRQAFQLAGAKTVVSTLWRIPDPETTELMTTFFDNLANGQGKVEALRNAQIAMITKLRKERGVAHPYYWAAFTLTGDWK